MVNTTLECYVKNAVTVQKTKCQENVVQLMVNVYVVQVTQAVIAMNVRKCVMICHLRFLIVLNVDELIFSFPMHPFSTPENIRKPFGFLIFSGGRERVHWE